MKKLVLIMTSIFLLTSCGPHRMSCGPKGICSTPENQLQEQIKVNYNTPFTRH